MLHRSPFPSPRLRISRQLAVWAALGIVYLAWGSTYLAIRIADQSLPPLLMAGCRLTIAGFLMLAIGAVLRHPWPTWRQWAASAACGLLMLGVGNGGVVWSEKVLDSGLVSLLVATLPVWVLILEAVFGHKVPGWKGWLGVPLGLSGVAFLIGPGLGAVSPMQAIALAVPLVGTVFWASGTLLSRAWKGPESGVFNPSGMMIASGLALLATSLASGEARGLVLGAVQPAAWTSLVYLIVVGSCVAFSAFAWLARNADPALTATYAYVNPAIAVALGAIFLHERLDPGMLWGAGMILASVILVLRDAAPQARRAQRAAALPELIGDMM